jgi:hypothetical protein
MEGYLVNLAPMQVWFRTAACLAVLISSFSYSNGQSYQSQLTGTVTDASGAVIPNADLTATNLATGVSASTKTNGDGIYRFPTLQPGQYELNCTVTGFKRFHQGQFTLAVDQVMQLDMALEPGQTTQEVTVTGAPPQLQTETSTLAQVVTTRSIQALPLNVRDPFALMGLTPGVIYGPNFGNGGGEDVGRNYFKADVYIGGGRSGSNSLLIDGAPDTLPDASKAVIDPPIDSVQEFSVQASNYDSQYGRTSGGVVNMITKSGTNQIHFVLYDFERHSVLDANNFFNNSSGLANRSFARHQYGADGGAPIRKNKWFVFGDYEALKQGYPLTTIDTLPTALQRTGNFSQTFTSSGALITIYDPSTLTVLPSGTRQRTPFPGNIVPTSEINPVSAAVIGFYPQPNLPGNSITNASNYIYGANSTNNSFKYDLRTDYNFSESTRMFIRYSREQDLRASPGDMPDPIGGGRTTRDHYTNGVFGVSHVFSPSTVADINLSGLRALAAQNGASYGFNLADLKLPASFISQVAPEFPVFATSDVTGTSNAADSFTQYQPRNVWSALVNVSHQMGKHSLKFGGTYMSLRFNEGQNANASGTFSFDRTFTQGPNPVVASSSAGNGFASFLLGNPTSGSIIAIQPISTYSTYYGLYVQDDWKVTSKLTVNFGVRWDVTVGDREKYNRLAWFNPTAPSPIGPAAGLPNLTGTLSWVGDGNNKSQQETDVENYAPRIGFAYSLDKNTVIRAGYGIFFLPKMVLGNGGGALEAVRTTPFVASLDGVTPGGSITNPFPTSNPILPPANDRSPLANIGGTITAPFNGFSNGYAQTWSLDIQRQGPWGVVLDAHYWANKGTRLESDGGTSLNSETTNNNLDQLPNQYLSLGSALNTLVANPFYGVITTGALAGPQISRQQSLLPYPQYTSVAEVYSQTGDSTYQAVSILAEKRLSTAFTFLISYTRSKAIDDVRAPLDQYDLSQEKGLSAYDTPNHFQLSLVYNIPFGRDRAMGKQLNRVANFILGDWDINSIVMIQSGLPIGISRPSVSLGGDPSVANPGIKEWFNVADFTNAQPYTFGNVGPVLPTIRTDWTRNVDAVLAKNFVATIKDRKIVTQFRWEVFNVLNTPQFAAPNTTVSSSSFGVITATANSPRNEQFGLKIVF